MFFYLKYIALFFKLNFVNSFKKTSKTNTIIYYLSTFRFRLFSQRLQAKVIKLVDVSYGGENGFNQAIELAAESLQNVKFIQEKKLIGRYFDEISQDTGKYCFGVEDTLKGLELGAVETLICWENLDIQRYVLKNHTTGQETVLHLTPEQEKDKSHFTDKEVGLVFFVV